MNRKNEAMRIGIDFGGVVIKQAVVGSSIDLNSGIELMVADAFESIAKLIMLTEGNVWIVSKASTATQITTRNWLNKTGFYKFTSFNPGHIYFCAKRQEKTAICQQLQLTHFIDDSEEVIQYLYGIVPNLYRFGVEPYTTWERVLKSILAN